MGLTIADEASGPGFKGGADVEADRYLELNYRVANSLQLVSSFLSLQEREVPDPLAKQALHMAASRVAAVGRVQRAVLGGRNPTMDLRPFLRGLCADLAVMTGLTIKVDADAIIVTASAAEHIAIVVSELALDAAHHHADGKTRTVTVACHRPRHGAKVILTIDDDGPGPVRGFEDGAKGVGMIILQSAVGLLGGELTFENRKSAKATLTFRSPGAPAPALFS